MKCAAFVTEIPWRGNGNLCVKMDKNLFLSKMCAILALKVLCSSISMRRDPYTFLYQWNTLSLPDMLVRSTKTVQFTFMCTILNFRGSCGRNSLHNDNKRLAKCKIKIIKILVSFRRLLILMRVSGHGFIPVCGLLVQMMACWIVVHSAPKTIAGLLLTGSWSSHFRELAYDIPMKH